VIIFIIYLLHKACFGDNIIQQRKIRTNK